MKSSNPFPPWIDPSWTQVDLDVEHPKWVSDWIDCVMWCQSVAGPSEPDGNWHRLDRTFYFKDKQTALMFKLKYG